MDYLKPLGEKLRTARKRHFPKDNLQTFSVRIGVSRATLQRMEKGDLSVSLQKYHQAAQVLGLAHTFDGLFTEPRSLFEE